MKNRFSRLCFAIAVLIALFPTKSKGQEDRPIYRIKKGTIGFVRVLGVTPSSTKIQIEFNADSLTPEMHVWSLPHLEDYPYTISETSYSIMLAGDLRIFDSLGVVANIEEPLPIIQMLFWCENDGGIQFRPSMILEVPNKKLRRTLRPSPKYDRLAAFASVGSDKDIVPLSRNFKKKKVGYDPQYGENYTRLIMEGRLSKDDPPVARITERFAPAGCFVGKKTVEIWLHMELGGSSNAESHESEGPGYGLWCCGP